MAENTENIVIDIEAKNADKALAQIVQLREQQDELKEKVKDYKKELKDLEKQEFDNGKLTEAQIKQRKEAIQGIEENSVQIRSYNKLIQDNQKVVASNFETVHRQNGSIREMRTSVASLTVEWENLSKEQREGARGTEIQQNLADLNGAINEASLSTKNFKDNIGNYSSAMDGLIDQNSLAGKAFKGLGIDANTTAKSLKTNVVGGLKSVGNAMKALLANPLFLAIAGITAILTTIFKAVSKNQEAMDALQRAMAPVGKTLDIIFDMLGKVAKLVAKVIEGFVNLFTKGESTAQKSVKMTQELEKYENDLIVKKAERNVKIANLEEELLKKEQYSHEERLEMAQEIQKLNAKAIEEEKYILEQKMKIWELQDENTDTGRESQKEYNEMLAKKVELDAKLIESNKKYTKTIDGLNKVLREEAEAEKKAFVERQKALEQKRQMQIEFEKQTLKELEDVLLSSIKDLRLKEQKTLEIAYQREVETIEKQLKDKEKLTEKAQQNLNDKLKAIQNKYFDDLDKMNERHRLEDEELENKKTTEKTEKEIARKLAEKELNLMQRREELQNDHLFELEIAQKKHNDLLAIDATLKAQLFESEEAYKLAVLNSRQEMETAELNYQNSIEESTKMQLLAVGAMAGAMSSMLQNVADESEALTKFSKALALVDIATKSGVAIAEAVKAGAGKPFPANLVAIAGGVAAVSGAISGAYGVLKSDTPSKPKELGTKTPSVSMPSTKKLNVKSVMPNIPTQITDQAPVVSELGRIEARSTGVQIQQIEVDLSIVDVINAQTKLKNKEIFAKM